MLVFDNYEKESNIFLLKKHIGSVPINYIIIIIIIIHLHLLSNLRCAWICHIFVKQPFWVFMKNKVPFYTTFLTSQIKTSECMSQPLQRDVCLYHGESHFYIYGSSVALCSLFFFRKCKQAGGQTMRLVNHLYAWMCPILRVWVCVCVSPLADPSC